jgi:DNA transformation protein
MSVDEGLVHWTREALAALGHVTMRKMMGGATLYLDGTPFAILFGDEIWFKADAESDALWDQEGSPRFGYTIADGRTGSASTRMILTWP